MDVSLPLTDLVGENAARVLRRLALLSEPLTTRQVAALSGVPLTSAARVLADLHDVGLVRQQRVGRTLLHTLNRQHVLWASVQAALAAADALDAIIRDSVQGVDPEAIAAVFGSAARRDGGRDSDIDILTVWPDSTNADTREGAIDDLRARVGAATGNHVDIIDLTVSELERLVGKDDPLVASWRTEARTVSGRDVKELIVGAHS